MNRTVEVVKKERERESYILEKNNTKNKIIIVLKKLSELILYKEEISRIGYLENVKEKQRIIKRIKLLQDSLSFL